jgi:organic radical activating enzyme
VVETFHSLQGEGLHAGRSAFFIRLGGCQVGCSWCDTKHSWPQDVHPNRTLAELAAAARQAAGNGAAFVVITGGEPLHHQLDPLCAALRAEAWNRQGSALPLHLETSGVDPLSGHFDWITLSPKPHRPPSPELLAACDELKVIVHNTSDLAFAEAMAAAASGPALLLQPGHACPEGQQLAIDFVKGHPQWRLSLQSHKWLGVR